MFFNYIWNATIETRVFKEPKEAQRYETSTFIDIFKLTFGFFAKLVGTFKKCGLFLFRPTKALSISLQRYANQILTLIGTEFKVAYFFVSILWKLATVTKFLGKNFV